MPHKSFQFLTDSFLCHLKLCSINIFYRALFSPEPSVFPSAVKKSKNENIRDINFACDFVWMRNPVSDKREEHKLRVFENKVMRRIFGPKRDEVTGGWRKMHNEELCDLYSSPSI
jgi:hypothetical protein